MCSLFIHRRLVSELCASLAAFALNIVVFILGKIYNDDGDNRWMRQWWWWCCSAVCSVPGWMAQLQVTLLLGVQRQGWMAVSTPSVQGNGRRPRQHWWLERKCVCRQHLVRATVTISPMWRMLISLRLNVLWTVAIFQRLSMAFKAARRVIAPTRSL